MSQYILILIWIGLLAVVTRNTGVYRRELVLGEEKSRLVPFIALLAVAPLIYMAATRTNIGDTSNYRHSFLSMPDSFAELPVYLGQVQKDKGFYALSALIHIFIGDKPQWYFFLIALFQAGVLATVYRKYSSSYLISVFLFLASTDYISWMFNGIRQFLAVCVIFAATGFLLRKKWVPTVLLILLASTMHQSALLMLPVVFIVQGRAWNPKMLLFLAGILVSVLFIDRFTNILDSAMQDTQYGNMVSDWTEWGDDGTNVFRVLVYAVPTILALLGRRFLKAEQDPLIHLCCNMSIVSTGLYLLSMFTSGIFIGRLPIYASLYNYILLPWEIDRMFTKSSARLVTALMILFYLAFYYYQMHLTFGMF